VLVPARTGEALLRGAGQVALGDIWGSIPDSARLRKGAPVSVFAAARDVPSKATVRESVDLQSEGMIGVDVREEIETTVRSLIHSRYTRGPFGPETDSIFVGNGVWVPPFGVRMNHGFVPALPLYDSLTRSSRDGQKRLPIAESATLPRCLIPQSLASVAVSHTLAPAPGETILDLCAAPGGKTHHIAQLMRNDGRIVAIEPQEDRLCRMESFLKASGVTIAECVQADGSDWISGSPSPPFDRALVDAPCSSSGLWPKLDWHRLKAESFHELTRRQFELLKTAVREVKPGGVVVYAVCSYFPQETTAVCMRALEELPVALDEEIAPSLAIDGGDVMGFFIVRFRRLSGNVPPAPGQCQSYSSRGASRLPRRTARRRL